MVGTSQKWPAKAGGRSPKGPEVAGTTVIGQKMQITSLEQYDLPFTWTCYWAIEVIVEA